MLNKTMMKIIWLLKFVIKCFISRDVKIGDTATVGECRPLSKTVKFNTLKITRASGNKKSFTKF